MSEGAVHGTAFVHPTAVVDDGAALGAGTKVWHFVHVCSGAKVGERCIFGQSVFVGPGVVVGNGVKVQNNVSLYAGVELEDDVFLGPSCVLTNVMHPRAHVERKSEFLPTKIRRGATVGANATIVCGSEIGAYAFIGAGSVVTRDVAPHALVFGTPARRRGWACRCGEKLPEGESPTCARCGDRYRIDDERCMLVPNDA